MFSRRKVSDSLPRARSTLLRALCRESRTSGPPNRHHNQILRPAVQKIVYATWALGDALVAIRRLQFEKTFCRNVCNGLISWKRGEKNYFANVCGRDLFRETVWKSLILKPNFRKSLYYKLFKRGQLSLRKFVFE